MKTLFSLFRVIKLKMLSLIRSAGYKGYSLFWLLWQRFVSMCFGSFRSLLRLWKNDRKAIKDDDRGVQLEDFTDDELYCGYDSTWESEPGQGGRTNPVGNTRKPRRTSALPGNISYNFSKFERAAEDMWNYRHDYPNLNRDLYSREPGPEPFNNPNLDFYLGKTCCLPDRLFIDYIHKNWYKKYETLEDVHTYIQWLFPLQEPGMNCQASTLTKQEIEEFCNSSRARQNLLTSYRLMLDFYGIELIDEKTGKVKRANNWRERFENLNSHTHNSLRITRILKCLGTLGYRHYQAPLVDFFLNETLVNRELPKIKESVLSYFVFAVLDKRERRKLLKLAYDNYRPRDEFVWCPRKIQMSWNSIDI